MELEKKIFYHIGKMLAKVIILAIVFQKKKKKKHN